MENFDLAIIGAGPAGLSTGIYAGRAKLNTLIIEKAEFGGQVNKTYDISNYPGARNSNGPKIMVVYPQKHYCIRLIYIVR